MVATITIYVNTTVIMTMTGTTTTIMTMAVTKTVIIAVVATTAMAKIFQTSSTRQSLLLTKNYKKGYEN